MRLPKEELLRIINENADRLCVFYITEEGAHLETLDLTNPASFNGDCIQLNCETTSEEDESEFSGRDRINFEKVVTGRGW